MIIGIITGINVQLNWFSEICASQSCESIADFIRDGAWVKYQMNLRLLLGAFLMPIILITIRSTIRSILLQFDAIKVIKDKYYKIDTAAYLVFLLTSSGYFGISINMFAIIFTFILIQAFLLFRLTSHDLQEIDNSSPIKHNLLFVLFFISGFAAIIYQVVWQRVLFQFFGVNIESVTLIVSVFMFGLGVGSVIGGYLSKRFSNHLPQLFIACELIIGLFGIISIPLFNAVINLTLNSSLLVIAISVYALLAIPTTCMGATLPILITHFHRRIKNVGKTVSILYFINTIGSAMACFFTVEVLFLYFGMKLSVVVAASCNIFIAVMTYLFVKSSSFKSEKLQPLQSDSYSDNTQSSKSDRIKYIIILILAGLSGFISMSQEILWVRYISFATGGKANVFAFMLGFILIGIALGSLTANKICERNKDRLLSVISLLLVISTLVFFLCIPLLSYLITVIDTSIAVSLMYLFSGIVAFFMGTIFPLLSHYAIRSYKAVGFSVSWIYFANIVGSTTGPLFTGFFLLNWLSFENIVLIISLFALIVGITLWIINIQSYSFKYAYKPILVAIALIAIVFSNSLYHNVFEKLYFKTKYSIDKKFKYNIQSRTGVISVISDDEGDIMCGGGIYDGRFNTDILINSNKVDRTYMFAALKLEPTSVLEIGLSTGSWSRIVANHQGVESLDIVEIDPDYIEVIKNYDEHNTLLTDPKVTIHIDDGRRWLLRNNKKFDFILMNTSFHWRDQINNLVSSEFIKLCKRHLKEGGVLYYNTTFSKDIVYTAAHEFQYVTTYGSFVAGSDSPFPTDSVQIRHNLKKFVSNGKEIFDESNEQLAVILDQFSSVKWENLREHYLAQKNLNLITDDNLASEYKTGRSSYNKDIAWVNIIRFLMSGK